MSLRSGLVVLVALVCLWSHAAWAGEVVEGGTAITNVELGKKPTITIARGKKAGLKVGLTGEVYPFRRQTIDLDVRLALAKVIAVKDDSATLALDAISDTVMVGDFFRYDFEVPQQLADSSLFRIVAFGVDLVFEREDRVVITTEDMLADPSEARRNKALDAIIADVKSVREAVANHLPGKVQEGKYHGKTGAQVVDELDRAQLLELLLYMEGWPAGFVLQHNKVPEVLFGWVVGGTPSGAHQVNFRKYGRLFNTAAPLLEAGKLDEARKIYEAVLRGQPDFELAKTKIKKIDDIHTYMRAVAMDPDDTASGFALADALLGIGAFKLALEKIDPLEKRKYDPFKVTKLRAAIYARLERYKEAEELFAKLLVGEHKDDASLIKWRDFARASAKVKKAPNDATGYIELGDVWVRDTSWDLALDAYRKAIAAPKATDKQKQVAQQAQQRISGRKAAQADIEAATELIADHDIAAARKRIDSAVDELSKLDDAEGTGHMLEDLAFKARSVYEEELARELLTRRVKTQPTSMSAEADLANALAIYDRLDEAEASAKKSFDKQGDPAYSHLVLAYIARKRGDFTSYEKEAKAATIKSPNYPWPLVELARVEAAKGNWDDAVVYAKKALDLDERPAMQSTHLAASRGVAAMQGLQKEPTSARERLRLVRALAELGLVKRATEEIGKLTSDDAREGWWAIANSPDEHVTLAERLTAARNAKPTTLLRKHKLAQLELQTTLRANPKDDATRIALAKNYLKNEDFDLALATLGPLMVNTQTQTIKPEAADVLRDARLAVKLVGNQALATEALSRNDFATASQLALEEQQLFDRLGTSYYPIVARGVRANVAQQQGKFADAITLLTEAHAVAVAWGDTPNMAATNENLAEAKSATGTNEEFRQALGESQKLCEANDAERACYFVYMSLFDVESSDGHQALALDYANKAWALADKLGRADLARNARFSIADGDVDSNHYADAEAVALKLVADARAASDVKNEQLSLSVLGWVAMMRGQGKQARVRFQEVYDLGTRLGDTFMRAQARRFEGSSWLEADHDPAKAAAAFEQADALYATMGGDAERYLSQRDLADTYQQLGKLQQARKAAETTLAIATRRGRPTELATANWLLAMVAIKEKKADDALKLSQVALAIAQKTDDVALLWNTWHAVAKSNELKTNSQAAIDAYEKSLEFLGKAMQATGGDTDKQGFMNVGRVREVHSDAVQALLKAGKSQRAMEILEMTRDATLKQQFDPTKVATKDVKLRSKLDQYEQARDRVQGLQKQLDKAMEKPAAQRSDSQVKALSERIAKTRQEMNQVVLDLKVTHRDLFQALAMDPQNLLGRADSLPKGSVLVEYFVADDALYAFVITANLKQPAVVKVAVKGADLEKTIADWRDAIVAENEKMKQRDKWDPLESTCRHASLSIL